MPSDNYTIAPNDYNDMIPITPNALVGIDTDNPITLETPGGSLLAPRTKHRHCLFVVSPADQLVIRAGPEGATVLVTSP